MKVLCVGGTGYLGQYLVEGLKSNGHDVAFTYNTKDSKAVSKLQDVEHATGYWVDLATGEGLRQLAEEFGEPGLVVNCAAISQPRACEEDPDLAMAVNVPTRLVEDYLHGRFEGRPALAHLSTDHVYRGRKALVTEDERSEVGPVNAYGRTKLEAETFVSSSYANHAIFRSSIIYGGSKDVGRTLFVQFLDQALGAEGAEFGAFRNEFRSPVYVRDIVTLCATLADRVARGEGIAPPAEGPRVFNLGGPERLSRADMARMLCARRGYPERRVVEVDRPAEAKSPADASMDSAKLRDTFGLATTPFDRALREIFP